MQKVVPLALTFAFATVAATPSLRAQDPVPAPPPVQTDIDTDTTGDADGAVKNWPQDSSDIAADSKAIFGRLPNGLQYVIYPNPEPPTRVSLRLHIGAGSLMEEENQRGVAHFLEHMVFNGSKNFSAAELIPKMQRLGISFGAHANAYTSFDETVYMLDLPDISKETLDLGFTVMRDFGDGALLAEEEIERERGVILSEKASRDSVGYRLMEKQFKELLPNALVSKRFPIGTEEVIKNASRERFVDFYARYYTPDRMTFVVSGDIDPAATERRIKEQFSSMKPAEHAGQDPDMGSLIAPDGLETAIFTDREVTSTDLSLMVVKPFEEKPDTVANRIAKMPLALANGILSRRLSRIAEKENAAITSGSASESEFFKFARLGSIDVSATDDDWKVALPVLEQEFRRAVEFGFTAAELEESKANIRNGYEQAVKMQATRSSDGIASAIARSINADTVFSSPETNLEIINQGLDLVTAESCHATFQEFWKSSGYHLILTTQQAGEEVTAELKSSYEASQSLEVQPPEARELAAFGYSEFGTPGTILSTNQIEDLGITQLVLSNQVRVNLKPTPFEKNQISIAARIGSGQLTQPADKPMFQMFSNAVFEGGGLGQHSNDELQQILAGRNVRSSLSIQEDAFVLGGGTTPDDFALQMQLMCATIVDPGYRNEGLWQFQRALPMLFQSLKHTTQGAQMAMSSWIHGDDSRYAVPTMEQLASYTIEDARKWIDPELANGYLELNIVGDFEIDAVVPEILATFGALAPRAAEPTAHEAARVVKMPEAPAKKEFIYESKVPQAMAVVLWKTSGVRNNQEEFRRLNILGEIYGDRLREEVRENLGASYSPGAGVSGSSALDDFGFIIGQAICKPEDLELLTKTMREIATELGKEGATADELDRAMKPTLGQLEKSLRDNGYWLGTVLSESQQDPKKIELARTRDEDYKSITLEEINALAKEYLAGDQAIEIAIQAVPETEEPAADQ